MSENNNYVPTITVDFDGTIAKEPSYPYPNELMEYCYEVMNILHDLGCCLILNTCREAELLFIAQNFLKEKKVPIDYFNQNCERTIKRYFDCRKINGDYMIDDKNIGGFIGWLNSLGIILNDEFFYGRDEEVDEVLNKYLPKRVVTAVKCLKLEV